MSTPFDLYGVFAPTGSKVAAALIFPTALVTGASTTITGGTLTGTQAVPAVAPAIYLPLSESPAGSGIFGAEATLAGTALPNTTDRPYTVEARVVASGTDMTSYAAVAAAYVAATGISDVVYARDVPDTIINGMLASGVWGSSGAPTAAAVAAEVNTVLTGAHGSGDWNVSGSGSGASVEEILAALAGSSVPVVRVYVNGDIEIRKGDSYDIASGQRLTIVKPQGANWPVDLTAWTLTFTAAKRPDNPATGTATLTVTAAHGEETGAGQSFHIDLTAALTTALALGWWTYDVQAASGVMRNTLISGNMRVLPELTTA